MKKILSYLLILPALAISQNMHKKISTLFLGNSYTYVNNLPLLIYNIALANGDTLLYDSNTPGGYTLANHFSDTTSIAKIKLRPWKFIVLQAQSEEPAFSPIQVDTLTLPFAMKLDSTIKKNNQCTNTVFYETWGRKNGDSSNCAAYPPFCTYIGMQNRLRQSYKLFADTVKGILSPAGEAFRRSISLNSALELYDTDQSHPSLSGSYLVAAVFYEVLFQKSVLTSTYNPGISTNSKLFLQQVAHGTVNDSLSVWNFGKNYPWADYYFNQSNYTVCQFYSTTLNISNKWYFGDGSTSNAANPIYYYTNPGMYAVSHVVEDNCNKDSVSKIVTIIADGISQNSFSGQQLKLFPNPCHDFVHITAPDEFKNNDAVVEIRNAMGQLVYASVLKDFIATDQFESGLYLVKVQNAVASANAYFIKGE